MSKNKEKLIIGIVALIVLIVLVIFFNGLRLQKGSKISPESTDVLPLEELAEQKGKSVEEFIPQPTDVPPLEELQEVIVSDENSPQNQKPTAPEPTNILPLEEL